MDCTRPPYSSISIHALVKRATWNNPFDIRLTIISIHALVKRATKDEFISSDYKTNFNPRPREEGDSAYDLLVWAIKDFNPRPREEGDGHSGGYVVLNPAISIHTLVKRATFKNHIGTWVMIFQSTPS